MIQVVRCELCT